MRPAAIQPVSVMVVDDSAIIRQRLRALLAEDDFLRLVGEAGSAAEAWTVFEQLRPVAVLLDPHLPDGNGFELLRRIKQASPSCLVVVLTNFHESMFLDESQRCGADHFLHKAREFEQVAELLHQHATRINPEMSTRRGLAFSLESDRR